MADRWLTFDCYGTLVDWRTGMRAAIAGLPDPDTVLAAYHLAELEIEGGGWAPYREVLTRGLELAARRTGVDLDAGTPADAFVQAWTSMPVFGDVAGALTEVRGAGWKLGIITNCDDDLFAGTAEHLPTDFDLVVTAQRAQSYRPDLAHFERFKEETGADHDTWVHVGTSWVHDVLPATRSGIRSIWTDRDLTGHPPGLATVRIDSLEMLAPAAALAFAR